MRIRNKILLCFLIVILISFMTIWLLYNATFNESMTELANESTMVIIDQANSQVETQIRGIERLIEVIADDLSVKTFMNENDPKQNDEVYLTRLSICSRNSKMLTPKYPV